LLLSCPISPDQAVFGVRSAYFRRTIVVFKRRAEVVQGCGGRRAKEPETAMPRLAAWPLTRGERLAPVSFGFPKKLTESRLFKSVKSHIVEDALTRIFHTSPDGRNAGKRMPFERLTRRPSFARRVRVG
jgi:hypothetical protein